VNLPSNAYATGPAVAYTPTLCTLRVGPAARHIGCNAVLLRQARANRCEQGLRHANERRLDQSRHPEPLWVVRGSREALVTAKEVFGPIHGWRPTRAAVRLAALCDRGVERAWKQGSAVSCTATSSA